MKIRHLLAYGAVATTLAWSSVGNAATVLVFGDRYPLTTINNFYNSYGSNTSTIGGTTLEASELAGVDLLWAVQPADAYSVSEIGAMANFLAGGGRIAFMGEHGGFAPTENNNINAALDLLGASMTIVNTLLDGSFRTASVGDGQILANPLTAGVNTYQYAAYAPITISGSAQPLMVGEDNPLSVMMAYQNIGAGSIFLITDQNVWDNSGSLWPSHDNEIMFNNLAVAITGAPPISGAVPEPAAWMMMLLGMAGIGFSMRRKKDTTLRVRFA